MDISQQRKEIAIVLNEEGFVSTLEEVADPIVAEVEPLRVDGLQRQHDARQGNRPALEREVDVVVHQAVAEHPKPKL